MEYLQINKNMYDKVDTAASIRSSIYTYYRKRYDINLTHIEYPQIINVNIHDKVFTKSSKIVKLQMRCREDMGKP